MKMVALGTSKPFKVKFDICLSSYESVQECLLL